MCYYLDVHFQGQRFKAPSPKQGWSGNKILRSVCARVVELLHISVGCTHIKILNVAQKQFYGKFMSPVKRNISRSSCKVADASLNQKKNVLFHMIFRRKIWQYRSLRSFSVFIIGAVKQFTRSGMDFYNY